MIVLVDLDGTVWDSEPGIVRSMEHTLHELGRAVPPPEVLVDAIGPPLRTMLAELGVPEHELDDGVRAYRERYHRLGVLEATLYDGVLPMLDRLLDDGHRLATATSKSEVPARMMLDHYGVADRFEVIATASMDGTSTTKAAVVGRALEGLGDPDRGSCVLVGDRHHDVTGAAAHGIPCIGACWGYGGEDELRLAGARWLATAPADVPPLVAGR